MFCLNDTMRYFLCPGKTDMRKGMHSLSGLVRDRMDYDVRFGDVFIFINHRRDTMKLLHAEDGGLVLYIKQLEVGRYHLPEYDQASRSEFLDFLCYYRNFRPSRAGGWSAVHGAMLQEHYSLNVPI